MSATPPSSPETPPSTSTPVVRPARGRGWAFALVAVVIIVIAGLVVGYEEHWFGGPAAAGCGTTLQGDGAQVILPLMGQWESAYRAADANCVNFPGSGSGTGITDFSEHPPLLDFAVTDDPLSASETAALPSPALTIPVIGGAITVIYNLPGVSGHLNLTGNVVAGIYLGTITNWDSSAIASINPGVTLPNATIQTVHRSDAAGTTYVLTDFLSQDNATWAAGPGKGISISWPSAPTQTAAKGNTAVLTTVEKTTDSIGYSDLTDVLQSATPPQYAAVENPMGTFVVPTIATTASAIADKSASTTFPNSSASWYNVSMVNAQGASDYPLATFLYMFVYKATNAGFEPSLGKAQALVQWLNWTLTSGQSYANADGLYYVALPSSVVSIDQAGVQSMTFNGAPITS
jgi:phosphate transport system substrate-binding protein